MKRLHFTAVLIGAPGLSEAKVAENQPAECSINITQRLNAWARPYEVTSPLQSPVNEVLTGGVAGLPCPQD